MLFFLEEDFSPGIFYAFDDKNHHYSTHVLRCLPGTEIFVFNGKQGKWKGFYQHSPSSKKKSGVFLLQQEEPQPPQEKPLGLFFCPIKRLEYLLEKAVELGVTHFFPIMSHYTQGNLLQEKRWKLWALEACRQSQRLDLPLFFPPKTLEDYYNILSWQGEEKFFSSPWVDQDHVSQGNSKASQSPTSLFSLGFPKEKKNFLGLFSHIFCLDQQGSCSLPSLLRQHDEDLKFWSPGIMVGPEGGWSLKEWNLLKNLSDMFPLVSGGSSTSSEKKKNQHPKKKTESFPLEFKENFHPHPQEHRTISMVSLGHRFSGGILRSETAALSALSLFL